MGVENLAPDPCLNSLCRQPRRVQKYKRTQDWRPACLKSLQNGPQRYTFVPWSIRPQLLGLRATRERGLFQRGGPRSPSPPQGSLPPSPLEPRRSSAKNPEPGMLQGLVRRVSRSPKLLRISGLGENPCAPQERRPRIDEQKNSPDAESPLGWTSPGKRANVR